MHPNEALVRSLYAAREAGDREAASRLLAEDVRWRDPYPAPYGGEFTGADEVLDFLFGPLSDPDAGLHLDDIATNDRTAIAVVTWWATIGSRTMRSREIGVYHVREGRIADVWFVTEHHEAATEFFSRPG